MTPLELPPWPEGQRITAPDAAKSYLTTRFADHERYAPALLRRLTELAAQPPYAGQYVFLLVVPQPQRSALCRLPERA